MHACNQSANVRIASVSGRYWLTRLKSRPETEAMRTFADWLQACIHGDQGAGPAA